MITLKIKIILTVASLAFAGQLSAAETFYVAPDGKDTNSGTLKSPFATITQARDAVRKVNKDSKESVVVNIRGGVYHIGRAPHVEEEFAVVVRVAHRVCKHHELDEPLLRRLACVVCGSVLRDREVGIEREEE